jgi:hypothetical protein
VIDVTVYGANHVQLMHIAGLSAHSLLITRHEALELLERLRKVLDERERLPELVPDD